MRTAIDRLSTGIENEVNILDFDGYKSSNRFVCPECGEYVFPAVGKKNSFKHYKGSGLDCDRRVDSIGELSFYERVGLPIYLIKENDQFSLGIGFYALGSSFLETVKNESLIVSIETKNNYYIAPDKYRIDFTFYENDVTIKRLNFIPYYNENYSIKILSDNNNLVSQIQAKWSDYADGFLSLGAIFSYSETKGKKFRKNDTITTNTEYYLLTFSNSWHVVSNVEKQYLGSFIIGQKMCYIYNIIIKPSNEKEFQYLENYFWSGFKLKLLYNKPDIVQLWPPAIKTVDTNCTIPLKSKNNIFCKVNSNAESPKVYKYLGSNYYEIIISKDTNGCNFIKVPLFASLLPLSIDRKYLANSQFFSTNTHFQTNNNVKLMINNVDLLNNTDIETTYESSDKHLNIESNINIQTIQVLSDKSVLKNTSTPANTAIVEIVDSSTQIWIYSKDYLKFYLKYIKNNLVEVIDLPANINLQKIKRELSSNSIDIPMKYKNLNIKVKKYPAISKLIKTFVINGKIPEGVLNILIDGGLLNE